MFGRGVGKDMNYTQLQCQKRVTSLTDLPPLDEHTM